MNVTFKPLTDEEFKAEEKRLIRLRTAATQLRFWDDAKHWQHELATLRKSKTTQD